MDDTSVAFLVVVAFLAFILIGSPVVSGLLGVIRASLENGKRNSSSSDSDLTDLVDNYDWVNDLPPHWGEVERVNRTDGSEEIIYVDEISCFRSGSVYFGKVRVESVYDDTSEQIYLLCVADFSKSATSPNWSVVEVLADIEGNLVPYELKVNLAGRPEYEAAIKRIRVMGGLLNYKTPPPYVFNLIYKSEFSRQQ